MLQLVNPQTRQVEKMSKSLGNVVTIKDFLAQYEADVFRLIVLGSNYRSPLTYNAEVAADNARKLERLRSALLPATGEATAGEAVSTLAATTEAARTRFTEVMDDNFNAPMALAVLFDLVRAINTARDAGVGPGPLAAAQATLRELAGVLGLRFSEQLTADREVAPFIELLLETRAALRQARQFQLADTIRHRLAELGVTLEDTPQGTRWKSKG
jgi:cysteinyl-tRNA synthetase